MTLTIRSILAAALASAIAWPLAAGAATPAAAAAPATVPAADFFSFAAMSDPVMSPDGSAIAVLVRNQAGRRQLAVIDAADLHRIKVIASFADFDIRSVQWADTDSLVFSLGNESESAFQQPGQGLFSIGRDGQNLRVLISADGNPLQTASMIHSRTLDPQHYAFGQTLNDGSGDIVVLRLELSSTVVIYGAEYISSTPVRLNVRTGALTGMGDKWPERSLGWAIDGQGRVRAAMQYKEGRTTLLTRDDSGDWRERQHFPTYRRDSGDPALHGVGADGQVYVDMLTGAERTTALYRYDTAAGRPDAQPLVSAKGFDIDGVLVQDFRAHKVLGVHYDADAQGTAWFDPAMKALQAKLDGRLPGLINRIDPADCGCAQRVLVSSHSDRQPTLFFLYDRSDDTLIPLGAARPRIDPRQMADTDFVRIKARDGHDLPVYVTKPHGKGPWPTVVLVHGGPSLRGWDWRWDGESQFLASRGYLVVKPEFRGSEGYGAQLESAGHRQWGLKMQDDIADATTWAALQGLADPKRTCIMGGSYGGYATLMGLARYGDLYRCGVASSAVTDINLMYDVAWSDAGSYYKTFGMPELIGDQVKDADQLKATSPIEQAARITRPLLLAHGGVDRRVPIVHATKLLSALQANHAPVTWIEYKDEAHGWTKPETRIAYYERVLQFLDDNIGTAAAH